MKRSEKLAFIIDTIKQDPDFTPQRWRRWGSYTYRYFDDEQFSLGDDMVSISLFYVFTTIKICGYCDEVNMDLVDKMIDRAYNYAKQRRSYV